MIIALVILKRKVNTAYVVVDVDVVIVSAALLNCCRLLRFRPVSGFDGALVSSPGGGDTAVLNHA